MMSEMEVPPNSFFVFEREGVTNNNDLGRRNPWRSGRQEDEPVVRSASSPSTRSSLQRRTTSMPFTQVGQLTINKIFFDKADYINAFSHSMLQREEVFLILTMSSRPAPCGSPAATSITSAMRGSSACLGVQTWVTRPWRSFATQHGGERKRWRRGPPSPFGREEKTTRRAEPIFAPPQLGVFRRRK